MHQDTLLASGQNAEKPEKTGFDTDSGFEGTSIVISSSPQKHKVSIISLMRKGTALCYIDECECLVHYMTIMAGHGGYSFQVCILNVQYCVSDSFALTNVPEN